MKPTRKIPTGLNQFQTILGVPSNLLIWSLIGYGFLIIFPIGFGARVLLGAVISAVLALTGMVLAGDHKRPLVALKALTRKTYYSKEMRTLFRLEIKK